MTFAVWLGEARWLRRSTAARVPGSYLRVLSAGEACAGDPARVLDVPGHGVDVDVATAFSALTIWPKLLPLLREVQEFPPRTSRSSTVG